MGKIGDIATLGVIAVGGYLILKNWAGIKDFFGGIAETFSVAGDVLGGAPGTGAPGLSSAVVTGVDVPVVETVEDIPPVETVHIPSFIDLFGLGTIPPTPIVMPEIDPEAEPPSLLDLLNPFQRIPVDEPAPAPAYTPSPVPIYQPPSDPIMDIIIPSDPSHPATDPFLGGR